MPRATRLSPVEQRGIPISSRSRSWGPHPEWGEEVVAFVVARPGAEIATDALDRLCLDHIACFKRPRHYRFVGALPKNNYGKCSRPSCAGFWPNNGSATEQRARINVSRAYPGRSDNGGANGNR